MDTSNPVFFLIDLMRNVANVLMQFQFLDISIWTWFLGFIFIGMVVSVFWRGARG